MKSRATSRKLVFPPRLNRRQKIRRRLKAMPSAAGDERVAPACSKTAAGRSNPAAPGRRNTAPPPASAHNRTSRLSRRSSIGPADVQQQPHRNARLQLEHLQKQLFQAQEHAPVHRAQIVAVMEMPMIQKFLPRPGEARRVVAAHQPRQRFLPMDRQPLELFEQRGLDQMSLTVTCTSRLVNRCARRSG